MAGHVNNLADRVKELDQARTVVQENVRELKRQYVQTNLPDGTCLVNERDLQVLIQAAREVCE